MVDTEPKPTSTPVRRPAHPDAPECIPVEVFRSSDDASRAVATEIAALIRERAAQGRSAVLGLATGSTPHGVYDELVRMHREDGLSFAHVVTFNLDEYWPMPPAALQSYHRFMREYLFDHVDIDPANVHLPDGTLDRDSVIPSCEEYEASIRDAGGIDLQLLGIGRTGHIGFNEPGSDRDSRTRLITLDRVTRMDAASDFFGERNVPRHAITMGVGTILEARRVVLLAFGEHKATIVRAAVEGPVTPTIAASFLQQHDSATVILDPAAAAELRRYRAPWLLGPIERFGLAWDDTMTRRAVIWLARELETPITRLADGDYNEHHLQDLLTSRGGAAALNAAVFEALQATITTSPAGDAGAGSRILVFSPHPDDDVISMGGTLIRLCEQGHDVHVAYQTSGNIAVWDESALRHVDFVQEFAEAFPELGREFVTRLEAQVESFLVEKSPGEIDSPDLQRIKTLIRRTEARAAARYSGVDPRSIHFLDLPFYETGRVRKRPLGAEDVRRTTALLESIQPRQIYAAGDLSDPHGTHRVCLAVIQEALREFHRRAETGDESLDWLESCVVWLYRGAWQEWGPSEIEMAVPLTPEEVIRKRRAIFKHESQKDTALFPGPNDPREFWQRAEDRNRETARILDALGLAEYEAIEGFVRWTVAGADLRRAGRDG